MVYMSIIRDLDKEFMTEAGWRDLIGLSKARLVMMGLRLVYNKVF
jgi:hypothetical protein